jgi:hypothetical protein
MKRDCACPNVKHQHGHWHAYANDKCRCQPCRDAWAVYTRRSRARAYLAGGDLLVAPLGTSRRLQALAVNGWSCVDLGRELGVSDTVAREWMMNRRCERISVRTRARVTALYERVWDQPGPGRYRVKTERWARVQGFAPPLAWDDIDDPDEQPKVNPRGTVDELDEVAIREAMRGRPVRLTRLERAEVHRRLNAQGMSGRQIALLLGTSQRSVSRRRSAA